MKNYVVYIWLIILSLSLAYFVDYTNKEFSDSHLYNQEHNSKNDSKFSNVYEKIHGLDEEIHYVEYRSALQTIDKAGYIASDWDYYGMGGVKGNDVILKNSYENHGFQFILVDSESKIIINNYIP